MHPNKTINFSFQNNLSPTAQHRGLITCIEQTSFTKNISKTIIQDMITSLYIAFKKASRSNARIMKTKLFLDINTYLTVFFNDRFIGDKMLHTKHIKLLNKLLFR